MPLHLLCKKSWNVYNKSNIERVRQDEADAEARAELRAKEDTTRRLAVLRGERPPSPTREFVDEGDDTRKRHREHDTFEREDRKRRRKLRGEDDTARDIRVARLEQAESHTARPSHHAPVKRDDAPVTDSNGHIQLFSTASISSHVPPKKQTEEEEAKGMRFQDAAGYRAPAKPWYTTSHPTSHKNEDLSALSAVEERDLWANSDSRRKAREQTRIVSADPFAAMQNAQKQLKQSALDKEKWRIQREKELKELQKRSKTRSRRTEDDELEDFSLDGPRVSGKQHHRRRHHRHKSRSRERDERKRRHGPKIDHDRRHD